MKSYLKVVLLYIFCVCVPAFLNENGPALGVQAGEERIAEATKSAGFSRLRRVAQTPFNFVFEARPNLG